MVRYQDIINDVNSKLPLLERWKSVYPLTLYYRDYLESCYGEDASSFMIKLAFDVIKLFQGYVSNTTFAVYPGLPIFLVYGTIMTLKINTFIVRLK